MHIHEVTIRTKEPIEEQTALAVVNIALTTYSVPYEDLEACPWMVLNGVDDGWRISFKTAVPAHFRDIVRATFGWMSYELA